MLPFCSNEIEDGATVVLPSSYEDCPLDPDRRQLRSNGGKASEDAGAPASSQGANHAKPVTRPKMVVEASTLKSIHKHSGAKSEVDTSAPQVQ